MYNDVYMKESCEIEHGMHRSTSAKEAITVFAAENHVPAADRQGS